jgi:hypothetical protein
MGCNCGERAKTLLGKLGFTRGAHKLVYETPQERPIHIRMFLGGVLVVKESYIKRHHFRVTLFALLAKLLLP